MGKLIESYNSVAKTIQDLNDLIAKAEQEISNLRSSKTETVLARIEKLEEQLKKIDEYVLKIKGFQELAKKNLDSQNVLTIEAPPGYRVNLNRLRNWSMMIDPTSGNDPYAQRVFAVAKCDECFLEGKRQEFTERIGKLREEKSTGISEEIDRLIFSISEYKDKLREFAVSAEMAEFSKIVVEENSRYWYRNSPVEHKNPNSLADIICPGAFMVPLPFEKEQRNLLKVSMGDYYDAEGGRVLLPVEINTANEYVITITCSPSKRKKLDKGLQNIILSTINENPAGLRKVYILDAVRYNSSSMGSLKQLEGTYVMEQIPRNPEQLTSVLEHIVSSFADMDEVLELYDSVAEYNENNDISKWLPYSTIVVFGWSDSYEGRDRELLQRILTNYERYGISLIVVSYRNSEKKDASEKSDLPEYAMHNAIHISMLQGETSIAFAGSEAKQFAWYTFEDNLLAQFVDSIKNNQLKKDVIGNEYIKRYSLEDFPPYIREYKKLELPFGIDGKDTAHSVSFENENFATYLVGASRSGKSTLLHTLIAGLIRNYHPDNVELWLADFKQLEFKRYIKHLPPHVKYVLLDESTELVFDLVDKLTEEMLERQKLFSRLGKQRIDQVNPMELSKPLPVIFVILDEFSIMSQSIAESPIYKLKLQNILAKGAALGIKFLFSSQTFTTGVAGLSATARAQIQQRIAMKGSKEEISETLELSMNLKTEQVRNWMDALPPHYALVKFRTSADTLPQVRRFLVMYFKDYTTRDDMIDRINGSMHIAEHYDPTDINGYQDKHPVLVDGNSFDGFDDQQFLSFIHEIRERSKSDFVGDEMFLSFGTPRLMTSMKPVVLSNETRENILLISRSAEQQCAASILVSAMKSYKLQGGNIEIWAYSKNKLYKTFKDVFVELGAVLIEDIDAICDSILSLKKAIAEKESFNKLIILIGIDRICMDFDYVDGSSAPSSNDEKIKISSVRDEFVKKGAVVSSDDDEKKQQYAQAWVRKSIQLKREAKASGKTPDEIKAFLSDEEIKFRAEYGMGEIVSGQAKEQPEKPFDDESDVQDKPKERSGAYNAQEDLIYVIKQGSRFGCHFLVNLNNFSDVKQSKLKPDFFRYKLAFQISVDDSRNLFNNKIASTLPEHICQFDDSLERYSFRPYLHKGIGWEGWYVDDSGIVVSPYVETDE